MDWSWSPHDDPAYFVAERHAEALTRAATRALRAGHFATANSLLRRRVRLATPPAPAELALGALAASLAGSPIDAEKALNQALAADAFDPTVTLIALRLAQTPRERSDAARRVLNNPSTNVETRAKALSALFADGESVTAELDLVDGWLSGWIAWTGAAPTLMLFSPSGQELGEVQSCPEVQVTQDGPAFGLVAAHLGGDGLRYRIARDGDVLCEGSLAGRSRHRRSRAGKTSGMAPAIVPDRRPLRIVMPVYGDPQATQEALGAVIPEVARLPPTRLVVVDDASPFPEITALLDALARRNLIELRRNTTNLGFTGAIARGLEGWDGEDVLFLNADVFLPPGALTRLADTVYSAPDIGSATPLSNNGEWTSWPLLRNAAPSPPAEEAERIDRAAREIRNPPIDLPNGVGFALFVRHDALKSSGGLPWIYDRGYFEDLEFTLQLRRAGFRNVVAPTVFAVHHGSRSFGPEKQQLVAKNLRRFRRRFPSLREESAAFRAADPLRDLRARIEAACPPNDYPILLVARAGSPLASERLRRHRLTGQPVVTLDWRIAGSSLRAELRRTDGGAPQNLGFDANSQATELAQWLDILGPSFVELAGAPPPDALADPILSLDAAFVILAGDLLPASSPEAVVSSPLLRGFQGWRERLGTRWLQVVASDNLTLAALQQHLANHPDRERIDTSLPSFGDACPMSGRPVLGLVLGRRVAPSQAFAAHLRDTLRRRVPNATLLSIGQSADDLALARKRIELSGQLEEDEFATTVREAGVCALVLPPADPSLALFERLVAETRLPGACADWTDGMVASTRNALFFDRSRHDRDIADTVVDWFAGCLASQTT